MFRRPAVIFTLWAVVTALVIALVNWNNHPGVPAYVKTHWVFFSLLISVLALGTRRYVLGKNWGFWAVPPAAFACLLLALAFLQPRIPTPQMTARSVWGEWVGITLCFAFAFFLEEAAGLLRRLGSRVPPAASWGFFLLLDVAAFLTLLLVHSNEVRRVFPFLTGALNLALLLAAWYLVSAARVFWGRKIEAARTFFLLAVTSLWFVASPDHLGFSTNSQHWHDWSPLLLVLHVAWAGFLAFAWEDLVPPVGNALRVWILFGAAGWGLSSYFNGVQNGWVAQAATLVVLRAWDPFLRTRPLQVAQGALLLLLFLKPGVWGTCTNPWFLALGAAVVLARRFLLGRDTAVLRTFLVLALMAWYAAVFGNYGHLLNGHEDWMRVLGLFAGTLLALEWENCVGTRFLDRGKVSAALVLLGLAGLLGWTLKALIPLVAWWVFFAFLQPLSGWIARHLGFLAPGDGSAAPRSSGEAGSGLPWNRWFANRKLRWAAGILLVGTVAVWGTVKVYHRSVATVTAFTPSGQVDSRNVRLSVRFSDPVKAAGDLKGAFHIEPALPGVARLEDDRTVVYEPSEALKPATKYQATFSSRLLKSAAKWAIQTSATTSFSTAPLRVTNSRLYFVQDPIYGREKELVAEIAFNYAVDPAKLKDALSLRRGAEPIPFRLEGGSVPTRFYVRAGAPARDVQEQKLALGIVKTLASTEGGNPLGTDFETVLTLPAKPAFTVESVQLHHRPGTSVLAVLFSLPVDAETIRKDITIDPPLPLKVAVEYRYAVLSADFKPNLTYQITIAEGARSQGGDALREKYETSVTLKDATPYVRFADAGRLIPLKGPGVVAVETMNLDRFRVNVQKVFRNNLVDFLRSRGSSYRTFSRDEEGDGLAYEVEYGMPYGAGAQVWNGYVTVSGGRINEGVENALTFRKWQAAPWKGLFVVDVNGDQDGGNDSRWFLATDLGLMAKRAADDLWVQVLRLSDVKPSAGVTLKLVSDNNQVIQTAVTDANGRAWFKGWRNNPYHFEPFLILAEKGDDWSFLRLDRAPLDASRFDVGGTPMQEKGWDGFLTSDRGLYRPGETVHMTGVVRHADLKNAAGLPVRLRVFDVAGTEILKKGGQLDAEGVAVFHLGLPEEASTGQMGANLELEDGTFLAHASFKVEAFIPHKIKVAVEGRPLPQPGDVAFDVQVNHLFGPPAAKLKVRSTVRLVAQDFQPKGWEAWRFTDDTRTFPGQSLQPTDALTDDKGRVEVKLPVPDTLRPASMMKAVVYAECFDTGGRPVAANASFGVHRYSVYLGLKGPGAAAVDPGKPVTLGVVALTGDGKVTKAPAQNLIVKKRVWYSIFHRYGWSDRGYESSYYDEVVEGKTLDVNGKGTYVFTPKTPGQYTFFLGTDEGARTSCTLTAEGIGARPEAGPTSPMGLDQPEVLTLTPDRKKYQVGQAPRLTVKAPFSGTLVLSVEREKVFASRAVPVHAGLNVVALPPLTADASPNLYVTGVLARAPREDQRALPRMSFGVAALTMDPSTHRIAARFRVPREVESRRGIPVVLETGVPGARVVLSAVDEGVLRIIGFSTPDPFDFFYRKRSLSVLTWSLFTDVLPELSRRLAVGGDADEAMLSGAASKAARHLNPIAAKRVVTYAKFEGDLKADAAGRVRLVLPAKGFHGEVRLMALAVKGARFGSASFDVKVADPVVLEPSFPRFLAPGDAFDLPLLLSNQTDAAMGLRVAWTAKGPVEAMGDASLGVTLSPKGQEQTMFHGKAKDDAGKATLTVTAKDRADRAWDETVELSVRPPNPLVTLTDYGSIEPGKGVTLSVPGGFIPQGQKVRLSASSSPLMLFLGSLDHLIGYPYGCAEQTVSRAFPMLYLKDLGLLTGRFENRARAVEAYVQEAVDKLEALQREDGTFAYWPNEAAGRFRGDDGEANPDDYLANYASHFLLEAKRLGYDVKDRALERIKRRIGAIQVTGQGKGRLDRREQNVEVVNSTYLLYLRALAGVPDLESMKALRDQKRKDAMLSLAFSKVEDFSSAKKVLPDRVVPTGLVRRLSGDWLSPCKYNAQYLLALAACDPRSAEIPVLIQEFGKYLRKDGSLGSTQDDAWGLLALSSALSERSRLAPLSAEWGLLGGAVKPLSGETAVVRARELSGHRVVLRNKGGQAMYYHLMAEGTALKPETGEVSNGLTVSREYRDEEGKIVNLGSVTQGQIVVVTLRLKAVKALDNVVLVDLLPAGFEVDNPRLSSRGSLSFEPDCSLEPAYRDFRDDRVLLFTGAFEGEQTFSYSVRAVTPGRYAVPALLAEAMYDPDVFGRSGGGEALVVTPLKY